MMQFYTPEEIAEAHDRNESFHGHRADLAKVALYNDLKAELAAFVERCDAARLTDGRDPNERERHALLWLDLAPAAVLDRDATSELAGIMLRSDGTVLSAVDGHVRVSFDVRDIWEE